MTPKRRRAADQPAHTPGDARLNACWDSTGRAPISGVEVRSTQRRTDQRDIGVCSDSSAGKGGTKDSNLTELSIPVTTNP